MNNNNVVSLRANLMELASEMQAHSVDGGKMSQQDDALTNAKIAASEARSETQIVKLEGKIDLVSSAITALGQKIDDGRRETATNTKWIIGTVIASSLAIIAITLGIFAYGATSFYNGTVVRDLVQNQINNAKKP